MADMHLNITPVAAKLHALADQLESSGRYAHGANALAEKVQAAYETWMAKVDHYLSHTLEPQIAIAADEAKKEAFKLYREATVEGHALLDRFKVGTSTGTSTPGS